MRGRKTASLLPKGREVIITAGNPLVLIKTTFLQNVEQHLNLVLGLALTHHESVSRQELEVDLSLALRPIFVLESRGFENTVNLGVLLVEELPRRRLVVSLQGLNRHVAVLTRLLVAREQGREERHAIHTTEGQAKLKFFVYVFVFGVDRLQVFLFGNFDLHLLRRVNMVNH